MFEKLDDIVKIDCSEGDTLLITLAENQIPTQKMITIMSEKFNNYFEDKKIKAIVVPYGTKVEVIKSSLFEDKE